MPFPRKLLNDNEDVVLDLHPHWATLVKPVALLVVAVAATVALAIVNPYAGYAGGALVLVAALHLLVRWLRWNTTNFVVTTERLIYRAGIVAKRGKEIPLERIADISFRQSIFERIIGAGNLSIESAGAQSRETFGDVPRPSLVQNEIYRQMDAAAGRAADRMAGRRELSIPEQIEKLDELRRRGVISQAEFDAKKTQLLDRM